MTKDVSEDDLNNMTHELSDMIEASSGAAVDRHKVSRLKGDDGYVFEGSYVYRGIEFDRNDTVPTGYFNRYQIKSGALKGNSYTKQSNVKAAIDKLFDEA